MNFSAFGGPFSGIHQFAAKFGHNDGAFTSPVQQDNHLNRYHSNTTNQYNHNSTSMVNTPISYGQNISIPYSQPQNDHNFLNTMTGSVEQKLKNVVKIDRDEVLNQQLLQNVNQSWSTLTSPTNTVDYSSHLLSASLPISIQHFLKYSETIKKENNIGTPGLPSPNSEFRNSTNLGIDLNGLGALKNGTTNLNFGLSNHHQDVNIHLNSNGIGNGIINNGLTVPSSIQSPTTITPVTTSSTNSTVPTSTSTTTVTTGKGKGKGKKQKKKKPPKEKKPRPKPGEIRETKALDGSPLFCCPECQMAYPERGLIEQHVVTHAIERRFVCDICNAALKRKDHLTRHKLSHIPDRPHICNICLKSFKRKEQLTLHIVIHTGEKKHVCNECGKGFYRKDHLRKHTRSHIARRVKSEMSAQSQTTSTATNSSVSNAQGSSSFSTSLLTTNMQGVPVNAS